MQEMEDQWLARALNGDDRAFSHLVETYQVAVYNLCYRMLRDPYEAEDAAQETFLRAYKAIHRYDSNRSFSTWLLSIAAHYCIDQIRRRHLSLVPIEDLPYQELSDPSPNPEASVSGHEEQERVQNLLDTLNATDRAAIIMRYWYELSYEEIAEALNLTVSAVKSRLHRSRRELAQTWKEGTVNISAVGGTHNESPAF